MFTFYRTVPPVGDVITLDEAKDFCRISTTKDENVVQMIVKAVVRYVEETYCISLLTQSWRIMFDRFPVLANRPQYGLSYGSLIELPRGPMQSLDTFLYTDQKNVVQQLVPGTDFTIDINSLPPRVFPAYQKPWPFALFYPDSVLIDYTTGYVDVASLPEDLMLGLRILIAHFYENRELFIPNQTINKIPVNVEDLLCNYRVFPFELQQSLSGLYFWR